MMRFQISESIRLIRKEMHDEIESALNEGRSINVDKLNRLVEELDIAISLMIEIM